MNLYGVSLLCFSFGVFLIAVLSWIKRKDLVGWRFFIFSFFVSFWSFFGALWMTETFDITTAFHLMRISDAFAVFIPITWAHFIFTFIKKDEPARFFYVANYSLAVGLSLLCFSDLFITFPKPVLGFKYYITIGPLYHIFVAVFSLMVPYGFYFLFKAYRQSEGHMKHSLKYLLLATVIGFTAGGLTFLPMYAIPFPQYLIGIMPLYPLFIGIALIRHGLFDAQEIADAFQREKMAVLGTMAASLNHEIKNPLFVVRGKAECYLDAVERKKYTSFEQLYEAGQNTIGPILNQVTRALDIVQRFTDFARPFNAKASKEKVVLSDVFQDVRELVSSEFQRSEVKLIHNLTNGVAVVANRRHIEEILSNLVINACHAVGDRGQVSVMAESLNDKVEIEVSDTGPGIPKENLDRVFKPFFTTKGPKGSGLGLYITKQLVERNGGKISVRSKVGEGTSFKLEFKR